MANEPKLDMPEIQDPPVDNQDDTPPIEPAAPAAPPPSYVTSDEFKRQNQMFENMLNSFQEGIRAIQLSNQGRPGQVEVPPSDVTDEEIEAALQEGRGAKVFRKMVSGETEKLRREMVAAKQAIENESYGAMTSVASEVARPKMKHYDKYKKEIDDSLAQLPPQSRANPQVHLEVYNMVAGRHMDEIIASEVEAAIRKSRTSAPAPTPGSATSRGTSSPTTQTVKEIFGDDADRALRAMGRDPDAWAKRMGYESMEAYMKMAAEQEGGESKVH